MARRTSCWIAAFLGGLTLSFAVIWGCGGTGVNPGGDDGNGGDGTAAQAISFNNDPDNELIATAETEDGTEVAIYGEKNGEGETESLSQIELALGESGEVVTLQLDSQGRVIYVETEDGSQVAFAYDEDSDSVRVEMTNEDGTTTVDESVNVVETAAARYVPALGRGTPESLCENFRNALSVLDAFFNCEEGDADCEAALAQTADTLRKFCDEPFEEVDALDTSFSDQPRSLTFGVKPFFTLRPIDENQATAILTAVVFGGAAPYDVEWVQTSGPTAIVENLPGGTAVADLFETDTYFFSVMATDAEGQTTTAEVEINADEQPKVFITFAPEAPAVGEEVTFSLLQDAGPQGVEPSFEFFWQFGDGNTGSGEEITHAFDGPGDYVVRILASSSDGRRAAGAVVVTVGGTRECSTLCFQSAQHIYLDCVGGDGTDEECQSAGISAFETCVVSECGEEFECGQLCNEIGRAVFFDCVTFGGEADACGEEAFAALSSCNSELCGGDTEPACEELCAVTSTLCLEEGADQATCDALQEDCLSIGCTESAECDTACESKAERLFKKCIERGGGQEECGSRARRLTENCILENCDEEFACEDVCDEQAVRIIDECLSSGATEEECVRRADAFFVDCLDRHCPDSGSAGSCETVCQREAFSAHSACIESGGSSGSCDLVAELAFFDCLDADCGDAPINDCEAQCLREVDEAYGGCLSTDDVECHKEAERFLLACESEDCGEASCEEYCHEVAQAAVDECVATSTTPEACESHFQIALDECISHECEGEEPPVDECEALCEEAAGAEWEVCMADGLTQEECDALFEQSFTDCVALDCEGGSEPPDGGEACREECEALAAADKESCLQAGSSAEECEHTYETALDECVSLSCEGL